MAVLSVHLQEPFSEPAMHELQKHLLPGIELTTGSGMPSATQYQILVAGRPKRDLLTLSPALGGVIIPWAGIPAETRQLLMEFPHLTVHNLHHNAAATAEMALALLLAAAKSIVLADNRLRAGDWRPPRQPEPSLVLEDKTVLILGYGAIGKRVARMCQGFGMRTAAIRRGGDRPYHDGETEVFPISALHDVLPSADVLIICLPHTPETEHLIAASELDLLPPRAVLVNVGRGAIVHEEALFYALKEGRLYAAGLDVWYRYPDDEESRAHTLPSQFPFHELNNVVMSPHRADDALECELARMRELATALNEAAVGRPIPNRVDLTLGY